MFRALATAALVGAAVALAPMAHADDEADPQGYLNRTHEMGFWNVNGDAATLAYGYAICNLYEAGWSDFGIVHKVEQDSPMITDPITFVVIAQVWLCPWTDEEYDEVY